VCLVEQASAAIAGAIRHSEDLGAVRVWRFGVAKLLGQRSHCMLQNHSENGGASRM
jgi:hypothetical protein